MSRWQSLGSEIFGRKGKIHPMKGGDYEELASPKISPDPRNIRGSTTVMIQCESTETSTSCNNSPQVKSSGSYEKWKSRSFDSLADTVMESCPFNRSPSVDGLLHPACERMVQKITQVRQFGGSSLVYQELTTTVQSDNKTSVKSVSTLTVDSLPDEQKKAPFYGQQEHASVPCRTIQITTTDDGKTWCSEDSKWFAEISHLPCETDDRNKALHMVTPARAIESIRVDKTREQDKHLKYADNFLPPANMGSNISCIPTKLFAHSDDQCSNSGSEGYRSDSVSPTLSGLLDAGNLCGENDLEEQSREDQSTPSSSGTENIGMVQGSDADSDHSRAQSDNRHDRGGRRGYKVRGSKVQELRLPKNRGTEARIAEAKVAYMTHKACNDDQKIEIKRKEVEIKRKEVEIDAQRLELEKQRFEFEKRKFNKLEAHTTLV